MLWIPVLHRTPHHFLRAEAMEHPADLPFFRIPEIGSPLKIGLLHQTKMGGGSEVIGVSPSHHPFYFRIFHEINHPAIKGIPYRWNPPNTHCKIFVGLPRYHLGHVSNYWQTLDGESFLPPKW
jgi:hypothetical protein